MSEENQTRCCLWCGDFFQYVYASKIYCSQKCHSDSFYLRQRDYKGMSPLEFKQLIIRFMEQGTHPNKSHPLAILDQKKADVFRAATEVLNVLNEKLQQAIDSGDGTE